MAETPTYTTAQIIALAKGTTNWYEYAKSLAQHGKNNQDDISTLQSAAFSGATPGWNAAIDTRWYIADTSSSATTYTGVTNPSATGSNALFAGYRIFFNPATTNTGAATLNVGTSDGAVAIKKMQGASKVDVAAGDIDDLGIYELIFDGTHWLLLNVATDTSNMGKVLQVVFTQGTSGDIDVDNNTTPASAGSTFLVSITPSATTSKILVEFGSAYGKSQGGNFNGKVALHRQIASGSFTNLNTGTDGMAYIRSTHPHPWFSSYVDSPSTTSAINYQLYVYTHGNDVVEFAEDGYWRFIRATEIGA